MPCVFLWLLASAVLTEPSAAVRVLHAAPGAGAVDVFVDGTAAVQAAAYGTFSPWVALRPGAHNFKAAAAGADTFLDDRDADFAADTRYTIALVTRGEGVAFLRLPEPVGPAPEAGVLLRAVHLASRAPAAQFLLQGDPVVATLAYGQATRAVTRPAGPAVVVFRAAGGEPLARLEGERLEPHSVVTAWLLGEPGGTGETGLRVLLDQAPWQPPAPAGPAAGQLPTAPPKPDVLPRLRLANLSPGAPPMDADLDGHAVARGLAYGRFTDYQPMPLDAARLTAKVGEVARELAVELYPGQSFTVLLFDPPGHPSLWLLNDDPRYIDPQAANLRVVHTAQGVGAVDVAVAGEADPLARGLPCGGLTEYRSVPAGRPLQVEVRPTETGTLLRALNWIATPGATYTILIVGDARGGEGNAGLSLRVVQDG
ncbi:MAG: DUF4397 domain-containing protein [Armatimonadetes bacterium]|nr:DUF4397 domain-containing protein [Armatimonadota bacterium]